MPTCYVHSMWQTSFLSLKRCCSVFFYSFIRIRTSCCGFWPWPIIIDLHIGVLGAESSPRINHPKAYLKYSGWQFIQSILMREIKKKWRMKWSKYLMLFLRNGFWCISIQSRRFSKWLCSLNWHMIEVS